MKKNYPINEGWLHVKLKHAPGTKFTKEDMLSFLLIKNPDDYEIAEFSAYKTVTNIILRKNRQATTPEKEPTP